MHWSRSQDEVLSMISHDNLNFYFFPCALRIFFAGNRLKEEFRFEKNDHCFSLVAHCFSLVSTCCPVSLYLHTYLIHYVTAVCMIACLSIVRSKLSDLYEWLHQCRIYPMPNFYSSALFLYVHDVLYQCTYNDRQLFMYHHSAAYFPLPSIFYTSDLYLLLP